MREYHNREAQAMADALAAGDVLAFPTDTVYGVGVMYGNPQALERLKTIKHRPETKPIPMMTASLEQAQTLARFSPQAKALANTFWPGALTLVVPLKPQTDRLYTNGMDTVAIRIPDSKILLEIMNELPLPLLVSSANVSGELAALSASQARAMLPGLDGILDGECAQNQASTIVDCTGTAPKILRPGPIDAAEIEAVWRSV